VVGGVHGGQLEWKQVSLHKYFMWILKLMMGGTAALS